MRGLFSSGICDVMMEHDVWPDGLIGVSAGAAFGCNYKSRQPGRAIRYNMRFAHDSRYSGAWSLLRTGDYFNAHFAYHVVPHKYDLFDEQAFTENPMEFILVCTDAETGNPVYKRIDKADEQAYDWIRASASMPLAARPVLLDGRKLLDGGVSDSIPLAYAEHAGYDRNVVILTQPEGYVKHVTRLMPLMRFALRRYPKMVEAMQNRPTMYNAQLNYVRQAELEGRCFVIRPDGKIPIGHLSHNPKTMKRVYEMGRETGERFIDDIIAYYAAR